SVFGAKLWLITLVVGVSQIPRVARVMRAATVEVAERDFVTAAEAQGDPRWLILAREVLPNVTGPLLVEFGLRLTFSIALVAAFSFLGLGVQPPNADWGLMINENRPGLALQPWGVVTPVIAIAVLTVGMSLVTDGIAHAALGREIATTREPTVAEPSATLVP